MWYTSHHHCLNSPKCKIALLVNKHFFISYLFLTSCYVLRHITVILEEIVPHFVKTGNKKNCKQTDILFKTQFWIACIGHNVCLLLCFWCSSYSLRILWFKPVKQSFLVEGSCGGAVTVVQLNVGDGVWVLHNLNEPHLVPSGQAAIWYHPVSGEGINDYYVDHILV